MSTMEKVMNLYSRPGFDGEKAAAREALLRMGLDASWFAFEGMGWEPRAASDAGWKVSGRGVRNFKADQKITILAAVNPKKAGTKANAIFALYRNGMTVAELKAAAGDNYATANILWDVRHGFISVE